jgi:hypothetical protein
MLPQQDPNGEIGPFPEPFFTYLSWSPVKESFLQVPLAPIERQTHPVSRTLLRPFLKVPGK